MSPGDAPGRAARERTTTGWAAAVRGPWTVARAVATVLLGPTDVTASVLDRANATPRFTRGGTGRTYARKRSHNLG
ncbi:hypothetical protein ACFYNZ_02155 [Streptomyces kebangsaanensis]|uniref:Uncharacterized protein n=1 Tax=Streptomyces kebangsaanensis TaxID=864058 RepID=A0ABW6KK95_9ACTN